MKTLKNARTPAGTEARADSDSGPGIRPIHPHGTPRDQYCHPPTNLDRLAPVRRARAIGLGRWLLIAGDKPVMFSMIERECVADGRSWRWAGQATRAETLRALDDLANAGGIAVEPYITIADIQVEVLPALYALTARPFGDLPL